ncbi:hypothetical protein O181_008889 [Austropuccinia psidii MF-1]|uniref:Uncharacterized protein n=1 Tax=Austropuccinia psidii MF-1 TaxID=1389203 RepID=A0A9Q3BPR5_9BASI|nr:hypothetical protein [Austropuccinia psidii MF-1]
MASSGWFDPSQTYDGYKAVEALDPASSNVRRYLWSKKDGPFGKEFPVYVAPTPDGSSGYSNLIGSKKREVSRWTNVGGPINSSLEVPISRINPEGVVKRIRQIANSPTNHDELDGEEVDVIPKSINTQYPPKSPTSPPPSPSPSTARPALGLKVRPSPIPQPLNSPMVTSQQLQPVASSSRRREDRSPLPFLATQVFYQREHWPIRVTREDPNMAIKDQDDVARLSKRVGRTSMEVIMYANDGTIPGTSSEEMTARVA